MEHWSDLAEEVARFYGYNEIPTRFTGAISTCGGFTPAQQTERHIGEICRSLGLDEIITYSFISPNYYDKICLPADSPLRESLRILNPLGEDTSIMRTTVLPSMLEILTRNYNYRNKTAALYEIGRTYHPRPDGLADEPKTVSLGAYGEEMNFFVLKGWVEALLKGLGIPKAKYIRDSLNPSYHPGRCATVWVGDCCLGTLGQIHPKVMRNYAVDTEFFCAQLSFDALYTLQGGTPVFRPLPKFPAVTRDIAVLCDREIPAGDMEEVIRAAGGEYLTDCTVFDVYTGHRIADGKKSVAFSLTMRAEDQTLTDEHAEETVRGILKALKDRGLKVGLITNTFSDEREIIRESGLMEYIDEALISYEQGLCKPDPKLYRKITRLFHVEPSECLFVGDGGSKELYAARDCGMHVLQCTWFHERAYEPHIPCPILEEFDHADTQMEVLEYLE